ncbi:MAG: hypothetical protein LBB40_05555 [Holophagales bacterium]|jgi:hypothetical protein|nr:hypothetical protein [Holophagales bacterium]
MELLFDSVLRLEQFRLKSALASELKDLGYEIRDEDGYLYATGDVPVMLVAHMDTVHVGPPVDIIEDDGKISSPQGIGGDDRAGVWMVLQIIKEIKCHVLFCEDEERHGAGAKKFTHSGIRPEVNYLIELDRRGSNDAVFYSCDNQEFIEFITSHGYEKNHGTFSDISLVAPYLNIAAVNLSTGFYNEHALYESIDYRVVSENIIRTKKIILSDSKEFLYRLDDHEGLLKL